MLPFSTADLEAAVSDGRVTKRDHPTLPYSIYNYNPETQWLKDWDDVTLNCRGLILDSDYNIIARPWKKFFNLGEVNLPFQFTDSVEIMDKVDGSLGILYPTPDGYAIATRGSFESEQAIHATKIWQNKYGALEPEAGYTFLFEIVFKENRIVLDYGDMDDLVLLGVVENSTGYYLGPKSAQYMFHIPHATWGWPGPVVEVFPYNNLSDALGHMDRKNAEGYVVRSHNFLVKLKQPDYIELHRLVTNASPKSVWEMLKAGKDRNQIISVFPDEFQDWIASMVDPMIESYNNLITDILNAWGETLQKVDGYSDRKAYAISVAKHKYRKFFFLLLDDKPIREVALDLLKPKSD